MRPLVQPPPRFALCAACGQRYDSKKFMSRLHHRIPGHKPEPLKAKKLRPVAEILRRQD